MAAMPPPKALLLASSAALRVYEVHGAECDPGACELQGRERLPEEHEAGASSEHRREERQA